MLSIVTDSARIPANGNQKYTFAVGVSRIRAFTISTSSASFAKTKNTFVLNNKLSSLSRFDIGGNNKSTRYERTMPHSDGSKSCSPMCGNKSANMSGYVSKSWRGDCPTKFRNSVEIKPSTSTPASPFNVHCSVTSFFHSKSAPFK